MALTGAGQTERALLPLRLPAYVGSAQCRIISGEQIERVSSDLEHVVPCPGNGRVLQCDFGSAEPLDLSVDALCNGQPVNVHQARPVPVHVGEPRATIVDWLDLRTGEAVVVASRRFAEAEITLPVAAVEGRAIRFRRSGNAPLTFVGQQLLSAEHLRLPDPRPGGELFATLTPATVLPVSFRLAGPSGPPSTVAPTWNAVSASSLTAGGYKLTPVYDGGVEAKPFTVHVSPGISTVLRIEPQQLGAIVIDLDNSLCSRTDAIAVSRVITPESGSQTMVTRTVANVERQASCWVSIGGLEPGSYNVRFLSSSADVSGTRAVEVTAQQVVTVQTLASNVVLSGRITTTKHPVASLTLEFRPSGSTGPPASARSDANGWYSVTLDAPGRYVARLLDHKSVILGQQKTLDLKDGANTFDWAIDGGVVTVRLVGWDMRTPVQLILSATDFQSKDVWTTGRVAVGTTYVIDEHDVMPLDLRGLAFGEYKVSAREQDDQNVSRWKVSREVSVKLTKDAPTADVTLTLDEHNLLMRLEDDKGQPVSGARVSSLRSSFRETAPGTYALGGAFPGSPMVIQAAGFSPTCRLVPDTDQVDVIMARGKTVAVRFTGAVPTVSRPDWIPGLIHFSEWGCSVPLEFWPFTRLSGAGELPTFRIDSFPDPGRALFQLATGYQPQPLTRGLDGTFVVVLPPGR